MNNCNNEADKNDRLKTSVIKIKIKIKIGFYHVKYKCNGWNNHRKDQ